MTVDIAFFRRDRALSIAETEDGRLLVRMGVKSGDGEWQWVTVGLSPMELLYLTEALQDVVERLRAEGRLFKNGNGGNGDGNGEGDGAGTDSGGDNEWGGGR